MNKGKIITFYSYKGGVGRTMSLANIATILARWGKRVLVIDWDLEAPGLEKFFMNYAKNIKLGKKRGVIDLLVDKTSNNKVYWKRYIQDINIANKYWIKYLGSGKKGSDYFDKLKQLDIDSLYEKNYGFKFIEGLRDEWKSEFDFVLIDSRTGITDNGGICTIQLPDIVLVLTATNEQSVLGTKEIIERINFSQQSQPYDRQNLIIFPILSRFDTTTEFEISQLWIKKVSDTLKNVYNGLLPLKIEVKEFIEKTKIPYFPYFSFGEKLSVLEQGYSDPSSMGYAYESLASLIVNNFENIDNFINNRSNYISQAKKTYNLTSLIRIVGVGGGGSNAVNYMFNKGIEGVDFVVCNTDTQALSDSPVPVKVQLGESGLGAGAIPAVAEKAALESIDKLGDVIDGNTEIVFIIAGMGGGTGTGAAPVIAKLARDRGVLSIGIVTLPFDIEGRRKMIKARQGIDEMRKYVDSLLVIDNNILQEMFPNLGLHNAFAQADNILTTATKGIAELITAHGYVNLDLEDVKTLMKDSGKAVMGSAIAKGKNRALKVIEEAMHSPFLNDNEMHNAKNILLCISAGVNDLTMDEISIITDYIAEKCGDDANVIWGRSIDESLESSLSVTIVAFGFEEKPKATGISVSFFSKTSNLESSKQKNVIKVSKNDKKKVKHTPLTKVADIKPDFKSKESQIEKKKNNQKPKGKI